MKHTGKYIYALVYLLVLLGLASCSSKVSIPAKTDGGADVEFSTSFGKVLSDTIKSVSSSMGKSKSTNFFSADVMRESMKDSDFSNVKVSTPNENSLDMSGTLPAANKQTHATGTLRAADFVSCGSNVLALKISPKNLKTFAGGLPQSTKNYLDLFMAPVFTGETMSKDDYKMLIASIYGENIAKELDQSAINVTLAPPKGKSIKNAAVPKNGSADSNKATFSIPLLEFLTLTTEKTYSIQW
jgi:hypothetical protein